MEYDERVKYLEREVELLKQIIELKDKIGAAPSYPVYVPYPVYPSSPTIDPWRPYFPYAYTTGGAAVSQSSSGYLT